MGAATIVKVQEEELPRETLREFLVSGRDGANGHN